MNRRNLWLSLPFLALISGIPFFACAETDRERDAKSGADVDSSGANTAAPDQTPEVKVENFTGKWLWAVGDDRFTLTLTQNGDKLTGFHSVQRFGGGKVDAVSSGRLPSITGDVHGTGTVVRFRSGLPGSEAYGHARLTLRGRYLYWELMDTTGEHYFPANAVLIRQTP